MFNCQSSNTFSIRVATLLAAFCAIALASDCQAQDSSIEFPYQALVARADAMVRSGPGKVHYGTKKLAPGDVVEVYRHDPGGWCAIRPTKGSFCIIPESTVEIVDKGIGVITAEGTTPFVGTELGSVSKPLWQIKLHEEEKVAVLGQLSWPNPEGHSTIWYQIKPPAGEFRWIHISDIQSLDQPVAVSSHPTPAMRPLRDNQNQTSVTAVTAVRPSSDTTTRPQYIEANSIQVGQQANETTRSREANANWNADQPTESNSAAKTDSRVQQASFVVEPAKPEAPPLQDTGSGWRKATRPIPSTREFERQNNSTFARRAQPFNSTFDSSKNTAYQRPSQSAPIRIADAIPDQGRFAEQLNQTRKFNSVTLTSPPSFNATGPEVLRSLNNRLTMEMLKDPTAWQFEELATATQQFLSTATPGERLQAQQFLDKLANCQKIAAGYGASTQPVNILGTSTTTGANPTTAANFWTLGSMRSAG
jgi:hypothetical protein